MSPKIYKKEDSKELRLASLDFVESGVSVEEQRGLKPLVLPEVSGLGILPTGSANSSGVSGGNSENDLRQQAASIIAEAEARGKEIEDSAHETAMMTFQEKVDVAVNVAVTELREEFTNSLERFAKLEEDLSGRVERDLVGLALAVAKKVIGREVQTDRTIVIDLLNTSLAKLQERSLAEVHLNPDDLEYVEANRSGVAFRGTLDLVPDPSISIGGCLIHTKTGDIDGRIKSQFDELSHGLLDA